MLFTRMLVLSSIRTEGRTAGRRDIALSAIDVGMLTKQL